MQVRHDLAGLFIAREQQQTSDAEIALQAGPQLVVPGFTVVGWQLTSKALASGSRVVPVAFTTGACTRFDHAEVETTADAVTITVYLRPIQLPPGTGCGDFGLTARHEVALPEPLGRRALLDGAASPEDQAAVLGGNIARLFALAA